MSSTTPQNVVSDHTVSMLMDFEKLKEKVKAQQNKRKTLEGQGEILNATFSMLCLLLEKFLLDKTGELKIKAETEDLKNRILSAEFENSSRAIIVKGLSEGKKSNDGKESKMALKSKFDKVVKTMNLSEQLKIDDIYRILPKETASGGDDYVPPIRVSFTGKLDRGLFMANLSKLKDGEFKNLKIGFDYPKSMLPHFRNLDEKAYAFRKKHLLSKTRIVQKDLTLVLLVKRAGIEEKFKEFDEEFDLSDESS